MEITSAPPEHLHPEEAYNADPHDAAAHPAAEAPRPPSEKSAPLAESASSALAVRGMPERAFGGIGLISVGRQRYGRGGDREVELAGSPSSARAPESSTVEAAEGALQVTLHVEVNNVMMLRTTSASSRRPTSPAAPLILELRWLRPGSLCAVLLLVLSTLQLLVILAMHCTPLLDEVSGIPGVRTLWLNVEDWLKVVVGVICCFGLLDAAKYLTNVTCRWRRHLERTLWKRRHLLHMKSRAARRCKPFREYLLCRRRCQALRDDRSPHFFRVLFASEVCEMISQIWAIHRYSVSGMSRAFIAIYTGIVAANAITPVILIRSVVMNRRLDPATWLTDARTNRVVNPLLRLGSYTRALLLLDATCDLLYSFFPYLHLIIKIPVLLFGDTDGRSGSAIDPCEVWSGDKKECQITKDFMLLGQVSEILLGSTVVWESLFKIATSLVPLILGVAKARTAFRIHYLLQYRVREIQQRRSSSVQQGYALPAKDGGEGTSSLDRPAESGSEQSTKPSMAEKRSLPRLLSREIAAELTPTGMDRWARRASLAEEPIHFHAVPMPLVFTFFGLILSICCAVWARLALWPGCPSAAVENACVIPVYPVLSIPHSDEGCACNALMHRRSGSCLATTLTSHNPSNSFPAPDACALSVVPGTNITKRGISRCTLDDIANPAAMRYVSVVRMAGLCPAEVNRSAATFLRSLAAHSPNVVSIQLRGRYNKFKNPAETAAGSWTLPREIEKLTTLKALVLGGTGIIGAEPVAFSRLSNLIEIGLLSNPHLRSAPPELGNAAGLKLLLLSDNPRLSTLPSSLGKLTGLVWVRLNFCPEVGVPPGLNLAWLQSLTKLTELGLRNTGLEQIPEGLGALEHLTKLELRDNALTWFPVQDRGGEFPQLSYLGLEHNSLSSIPGSLMQLGALKDLRLARNGITASSQGVFVALPQLAFVSLEANNLTGPSVTAAFGTNTARSGSSGNTSAIIQIATASPNLPQQSRCLVLLGNNPACTAISGEEGYRQGSTLTESASRFHIECQPECAVGCTARAAKGTERPNDVDVCQKNAGSDVTCAQIGDGHCNMDCYVEACNLDGGDCDAEGFPDWAG